MVTSQLEREGELATLGGGGREAAISSLFGYVLASLYAGVSVRTSIRLSVCTSIIDAKLNFVI